MNRTMDEKQFDSFDWENTARQLQPMSSTASSTSEPVDHVDGHADSHFDGHFDGTKTLQPEVS